MTRILVRELKSPVEFGETVNVAKEAWGFGERALSPANDLIAVTHAGGLTAAAFEAGKMLGFVHGIPRTNCGEPCLHSHLLAVRPDAQGRGIGARLKLFQRAWCLARGVRLVTWTYDPFLVKNASLNLVRLGARATGLLLDFYGPLGGIYGALPTDRFEVEWRLEDPDVAAAAEGRARQTEEPPSRVVESPRAVPRDGSPVSLPMLEGAPAVYRRDPKRSLEERIRFRAVARSLFSAGYEATSIAALGPRTVYVMERR